MRMNTRNDATLPPCGWATHSLPAPPPVAFAPWVLQAPLVLELRTALKSARTGVKWALGIWKTPWQTKWQQHLGAKGLSRTYEFGCISTCWDNPFALSKPKCCSARARPANRAISAPPSRAFNLRVAETSKHFPQFKQALWIIDIKLCIRLSFFQYFPVALTAMIVL